MSSPLIHSVLAALQQLYPRWLSATSWRQIDSTVKAEDLFKTGEYGCMIAEVPADALDKVNVAYTLIGEVTDTAKVHTR